MPAVPQYAHFPCFLRHGFQQFRPACLNRILRRFPSIFLGLGHLLHRQLYLKHPGRPLIGSLALGHCFLVPGHMQLGLPSGQDILLGFGHKLHRQPYLKHPGRPLIGLFTLGHWLRVPGHMQLGLPIGHDIFGWMRIWMRRFPSMILGWINLRLHLDVRVALCKRLKRSFVRCPLHLLEVTGVPFNTHFINLHFL